MLNVNGTLDNSYLIVLISMHCISHFLAMSLITLFLRILLLLWLPNEL